MKKKTGTLLEKHPGGLCKAHAPHRTLVVRRAACQEANNTTLQEQLAPSGAPAEADADGGALPLSCRETRGEPAGRRRSVQRKENGTEAARLAKLGFLWALTGKRPDRRAHPTIRETRISNEVRRSITC